MLKTIPRQTAPAHAAPTIPSWVNQLMIGVLRSPFHSLLSRTTTVLTVNGRRSGRRYTIPVRYLRADDRVLVTTDSRWWLNLQGGAQITLHLRGREVAGWAEVSTDPEAVEQAILAFLRQMPRDASFYQIPLDRSGRPDPASVKRAIRDRVLITVYLDNQAG
jgi:hypothetical protein